MSQPVPYNRNASFTNFQAANPTSPLVGSTVDLELNAIKATLDAVLANLALIQNDDTTVKNTSIGINQMSAAVALGFNPVKTWVTGTAFTASPASTVFNGSSIYVCLISHTGGVFATDLAAGKWQLILNLAAVPITAATQVSVVASGLLTTDAQTSLQALDTGKAATSHTHASTAISDSSIIGRSVLTAADAATIVAALGLAAPWTTGDIKLTYKNSADAGWLMLNDTTIGSAFSGATFADATAQPLFLFMWSAVIDTWAPVSTGRGVSAAADWAANKTITLTKTLGRAVGLTAPGGLAGSGLTARTTGQAVGEETHVLTAGESAVLAYGTILTNANNVVRSSGILAINAIAGAASEAMATGTSSVSTLTAATSTNAGGLAHNNMQPTVFFNAMIKL